MDLQRFFCFSVLLYVVLAQTECPAAPSTPEDRRLNKSELRVATYNGEWLFTNRSNCPGSGCPWPNKTMVNLMWISM
jgi:hypothetical protein